jgi:hypothetical protein
LPALLEATTGAPAPIIDEIIATKINVDGEAAGRSLVVSVGAVKVVIPID